MAKRLTEKQRRTLIAAHARKFESKMTEKLKDINMGQSIFKNQIETYLATK